MRFDLHVVTEKGLLLRIGDLLDVPSLDLEAVWTEPELLFREFSAVTSTDLEDPSRFLEAGEAVMTGLVWWSSNQGKAKADRFVSALRESGAVALLAGVERHGNVPADVIRACKLQRIPLIAIPKHTSFRAITDEVYLRNWGGLGRRTAALPEHVKLRLDQIAAANAPYSGILNEVKDRLGGLVCHLVTATGRTVAHPAGEAPPPARRVARDLRAGSGTYLAVEPVTSPYDTWYLHVPDTQDAPPRMLEANARPGFRGSTVAAMTGLTLPLQIRSLRW